MTGKAVAFVIALVAGLGAGAVALAAGGSKHEGDEPPPPPPKPDPSKLPPPPSPPPTPPPPPSPPPSPTPTPAKSRWKRATTLQAGKRYRIAVSNFNFPDQASFVDFINAISSFRLPMPSNDPNADRVDVWAPGSPMLPADWPADDPGKLTEWHAEFTVKQPIPFSTSDLNVPVILWERDDAAGAGVDVGGMIATGRPCHWTYRILYELGEGRWAPRATSYFFIASDDEIATGCAQGGGAGWPEFYAAMSDLCRRGAVAGIQTYDADDRAWHWQQVQCAG